MEKASVAAGRNNFFSVQDSTCPTYLMVFDIGSDPQKQKKRNFWQNSLKDILVTVIHSFNV